MLIRLFAIYISISDWQLSFSYDALKLWSIKLPKGSLSSSNLSCLSSVTGPLHWVLQVPSIFLLHNSTGPMTTMRMTITTTILITELQTLCWFGLSLGSGASNYSFHPGPPPHVLGFSGSVLPAVPLLPMADIHYIDNSREPMGCDVNCRLEMNTYKWK